MKGRIQAGAQIDALILTAPEQVRAPLRKLTSKQRIRACSALRPGPVSDPSRTSGSRSPRSPRFCNLPMLSRSAASIASKRWYSSQLRHAEYSSCVHHVQMSGAT
jgi:hypothetical protein